MSTMGGTALLPLAAVMGAVFSYEGSVLPSDGGWMLIQAFCDPSEYIENGALVHAMSFCPKHDPPVGQQIDYTRALDDFIGAKMFFAEWRVGTTGDRSEISFVAPVAIVLFNHGSVDYHFTIAQDLVKLNRDNQLPIVFVEIERQVPHTYRLELNSDSWYAWYIDGMVVDEGIPEGLFTAGEPAVNIRSKAKFVESTTRWDYIRWGEIAIDASGDFDSDGDHDLRDFYFLHECVASVDRPVMVDGGVDPGCLWADVNEDDRVDLLDFGEFQILASDSPD